MITSKIMLRSIFLLFLFIFSGCNQPNNKEPHIQITTSFGDIEIELYPEKAPKTVAAFLSYIDSGYYNNCSFYRVLKTEDMVGNNFGVIQGGIWQTNDQLHPYITRTGHESTQQSGLTHTTGTISMARTKNSTAGTEFFICIGDQTHFDYGPDRDGDKQGYAAFGKVIKGMKIARMIQNQPAAGEHFINKIIITGIKRL